jgi:hypothetical protein
MAKFKMNENRPHVIVALLTKHYDEVKGTKYTQSGSILIGERPTEAEANKERDRRNALVRDGDPAHKGREYIVMRASEYRRR